MEARQKNKRRADDQQTEMFTVLVYMVENVAARKRGTTGPAKRFARQLCAYPAQNARAEGTDSPRPRLSAARQPQYAFVWRRLRTQANKIFQRRR